MREEPPPFKPYGDAHFVDRAELRTTDMATDSSAAVPFGKLVEGGEVTRQSVGYPGERHTLIFGPNGSGKSLRLLVPLLLHAKSDRSFCVIDPKGQLAAITAKHRAKYGPVYVINPFGVLTDEPDFDDLRSCGFNPLASLDPASPSFNADAGLLAEALITMEGDQPFFPRMARNLVAALIMWEAIEAKREKRAPRIATIRDQLANPEGLPELLATMSTLGPRGIQNKARPMLQKAKSVMDVVSEAAGQTEFLDDDEMVVDLARDTGPDFATMKDQSVTVYLIMPAEMMERHAKWFRLVLSAALRATMTRRKEVQLPVTFVLEEYFLIASGGLKIIENCMAYVRGFGIQLMPVLQDLNQLQDLYPKRWQTFMSNSGAIAAFGPNDLTTAEWMSKRAGDCTAVTASYNSGGGMGFSPDQEGNAKISRNQSGGASYGQTRVPFLSVHNLLNTKEGRLFVWENGLANTIQTEAKIFADPHHPLGLKKLARRDPYYVE